MESNTIAGHLSEVHGSPVALGASVYAPLSDTTMARSLLNVGYDWTPNGRPTLLFYTTPRHTTERQNLLPERPSEGLRDQGQTASIYGGDSKNLTSFALGA
ncbi:hypothetical protein BDV23DRAFT_189257 [Aspergillus alliaceus]|uniref:Uncharacterized protein n=1 Tax=Petromyces alliaceus TaxID=209559 RepID=A0A5N7BS16_PETAA|nr:hypothetical protein BDV23DRAFT_189257 [Aspergillus alliaceus]